MRIAGMLLGMCWFVFFAFWIVKSRNIKQATDTGKPGNRWIFIILVVVGLGLMLRSLAAGAKPEWLRVPLWSFSEARAALGDWHIPALVSDVHQRIVFAESVAAGRVASEVNPRGAAACEIAALAREVEGLIR